LFVTATVGARPATSTTPSPGAAETLCNTVNVGTTSLVIVKSGDVSRNVIESASAVSAPTICSEQTVSEQPRAAMSLELPPESPSSVQPALDDSNVPVPVSRLVVFAAST